MSKLLNQSTKAPESFKKEATKEKTEDLLVRLRALQAVLLQSENTVF